jgi:tetratricopeptide (TPR) repeat protein
VVLGVRLAGALCLFWYGKGYHVEAIRWLDQLFPHLDDVPLMFHSKFLITATHMAWFYDLDKAQHMITRALEISRELGDKFQTAWVLILLGYTMMREPEVALPIAVEGLSLFRELNYQPGIAQALNIVGEIARLSGDDEHAKRAYEECLVVSRATGETRRICYICNNLAYIAQHEGQHKHAIDLGRQSLLLAHDRKVDKDMAEALSTLAGSIGALGQPRKAAQLLGASEAGLERMGAFHTPSDRPEYDRIIAEVRAQLDDASFQTARAEGRKMTLSLAVENALQDN